ncbi:undecaprenyl diphosphate synthase family protein [Vibrio sp.]|uniref:undecaprenyl diphosphate synthase family protein n=1 Tax=Vibrio sp. TaxID=678 RepID=UPI003AA87714
MYSATKGVSAVRKTVTAASRLGIKSMTLFAGKLASSRGRSWLLMELFISVLSSEVKLRKNNLQLRVIGDTSRFSERLQEDYRSRKANGENTGMVINIAANYGGKWDITQAAKR